MNSLTTCLFRGWSRGCYGGLAVILLSVLVSACSKQSPVVFDSPEAAIQELASLIGKSDVKRLEEVFGPDSADVLLSGDPDQDREDYARVGEMIEASVEFEDFDENTEIALLGDEGWPWPIPLVRDGDGWRFDIAKGREELLNRRIGRNELWTLTALHELVGAQQEYVSEPRDGNLPAYAQKFRSTEGKRDGLYWTTEDQEELSPLGDLLAESDAWGPEPHPFYGYFYRMLTSQGENAPGGATDYLDDTGLMTGGFAAVAWPAKYGNSGVMTFVINHRGIIFQKDLGADTEQAVTAITSFDPDDSWTPTGDTVLEIEEGPQAQGAEQPAEQPAE
jgi:Protein of unknown function (DUF2950)